jgi:hypothetical protein
MRAVIGHKLGAGWIGRDVLPELDDGKQVHLRPHAMVVQNGTRQAWRNSVVRTAGNDAAPTLCSKSEPGS